MKKLKKYWLNEHGERYWYFKSNITITAHRSYYWNDRISYINEQRVETYNGRLTTSGRRCLGKKDFEHPDTYTEFKLELDNWTPISDYSDYTKMLNSHYICENRKNKLKIINESN